MNIKTFVTAAVAAIVAMTVAAPASAFTMGGGGSLGGGMTINSNAMTGGGTMGNGTVLKRLSESATETYATGEFTLNVGVPGGVSGDLSLGVGGLAANANMIKTNGSYTTSGSGSHVNAFLGVSGGFHLAIGSN